MDIDVLLDSIDDIARALRNTAANAIDCKITKKALNHVEP